MVAQVQSKAIGLMGLTQDVDSKLLHECFELEPYDNLLKPEFMDAVRKRREYLLEETRKRAEEERQEELRRLKEETMRCNIISQRIAFQEFCKAKAEEILEEIEPIINDEEQAKNIHRPDVEAMFAKWFGEFPLEKFQPSEYFLDHPTDDSDLQSTILNNEEFLLDTLGMFELPKGYMEGKGHFPNFGKEKDNKGAA